MRRNGVRGSVCAVVLLLFVGCGGLTYTITKPAVSAFKYVGEKPDKITIKIIDKRVGDDTLFMKNTANLANANIALEQLGNPMTFLIENLEAELRARNIQASCVLSGEEKGDIQITVERFQIINRRISGYSPWESFHVFKGTVTNATGTFPLHAYFFNGKVPVWSMGEIAAPCINTPLSIIIKEIATKVNRLAIGAKSGDDEVGRLAKEIDANMGKEDNGPFWKVFELGATNNPSAMEPLKKYCASKDNFFKACALSAIGQLGPQAQFEFLKNELTSADEISKFMTLKSIGDIEDQQSREFISKQPNSGNEDGIAICQALYTK